MCVYVCVFTKLSDAEHAGHVEAAISGGYHARPGTADAGMPAGYGGRFSGWPSSTRRAHAELIGVRGKPAADLRLPAAARPSPCEGPLPLSAVRDHFRAIA